MRRHFAFLAALAALALVPSMAQARGYRRGGGYVNTPFGRMNMNSPEYRMSGGNPIVYQQLMQQEMLMKQQQMMLKQQQQYMRQMQKQGKKGNTNLQPSTGSFSNVTTLSPGKKRKKPRTAAKAAVVQPETGKTDESDSKP